MKRNSSVSAVRWQSSSAVPDAERGQAAGSRWCAQCTAPLRPHARYCGACGRSVRTVVVACRQCQAPVAPEQRECPCCGELAPCPDCVREALQVLLALLTPTRPAAPAAAGYQVAPCS